MKSRYLCKHLFHAFCQDLNKAQQDWEQSIAVGLEALNANKIQQAERCFGAAYEIANIIFDRQASNSGEPDMAANTLLSAQYLTISLIQLDYQEQAEFILKQLHEKFNFVCRNPNADQNLRETLCDSLIPYLEKLYHLALRGEGAKQTGTLNGNLIPESFRQLFNGKRSKFYHNSSTLYH